MRKVIVSEMVHRNGKWQPAEKGEALFHQFGTDYEEFESGPEILRIAEMRKAAYERELRAKARAMREALNSYLGEKSA